jgi:hypothetical protein
MQHCLRAAWTVAATSLIHAHLNRKQNSEQAHPDPKRWFQNDRLVLETTVLQLEMIVLRLETIVFMSETAIWSPETDVEPENVLSEHGTALL